MHQFFDKSSVAHLHLPYNNYNQAEADHLTLGGMGGRWCWVNLNSGLLKKKMTLATNF